MVESAASMELLFTRSSASLDVVTASFNGVYPGWNVRTYKRERKEKREKEEYQIFLKNPNQERWSDQMQFPL